MVRILFFGTSALDAIYRVPRIPAQPTKVLATGFTECGGGMAANASVAVARLGGAAHYWGRVGADELTARILAQPAAERVDASAVRRVPDCVSPSAAILVADDGEWLACAYNDPHLDQDASWLPLAAVDTLAAGDVWHGAFALALGEGRDVAAGARFASAGRLAQVHPLRRPAGCTVAGGGRRAAGGGLIPTRRGPAKGARPAGCSPG